MFPTRRKGLTNNAGFRKFATQIEDCHWSDGGSRRDCSRDSVLAVSGFFGIADATVEPAACGVAKENERSGTVAGDRSESRARERPDHRFLSGSLCRQGFRSARRAGKTGSGERSPHGAGKIQARGSGNLWHRASRNSGQFFRRLSAIGKVYQHAGTVKDVYCGGQRGPGRRKYGTGTA